MSLLDRLNSALSSLRSSAPQLQAIEGAANAVIDAVAVAVPGAAPVVATIHAAEAVGNTVVSAVSSIGEAPAPAAGVTPHIDVVQNPPAVNVPPAPAALDPAPAPVAGVDNAALAATHIASTSVTPEDLAARVVVVENSLAEVLSALADLSATFGKIAHELGH